MSRRAASVAPLGRMRDRGAITRDPHEIEPARTENAPAETDLGPGFELMTERPPPGLLRRFLTTQRHAVALLAGGLVAYVAAARARGAGGVRLAIAGALAWLVRPLIRRDLRDEPFPVQLRRRLELLGPTYIKLGQILSLREDILPRAVTDELRHLLNQLPVVRFERFRELVADDLGRPLGTMFDWIDPVPLGSASIAQIHRARTVEGDEVVLKVVKPGVRGEGYPHAGSGSARA